MTDDNTVDQLEQVSEKLEIQSKQTHTSWQITICNIHVCNFFFCYLEEFKNNLKSNQLLFWNSFRKIN